MKQFLTKKSGSEVILEEVNPYRSSVIGYTLFTPLILTSIDPNIKVGEVIREDQLEISYEIKIQSKWQPCGYLTYKSNTIEEIWPVRQVAKLKQPVHETPKSDHDLETCPEKEEKVTGEETIQEEETGEREEIVWDEVIHFYNSGDPLEDNHCSMIRQLMNKYELKRK